MTSSTKPGIPSPKSERIDGLNIPAQRLRLPTSEVLNARKADTAMLSRIIGVQQRSRRGHGGPKTWNSSGTLGNLADILREQQRYIEAEPLYVACKMTTKLSDGQASSRAPGAL